MGRIVLSDADPATILGDVRATMINAGNEGEPWEGEAQRVLGSPAQEAFDADAALTKLQELLDLEESALASASRALDLAVASAKDEVWNKLGRPASNRDMVLTFPTPLRDFYDLQPGDKPARTGLVIDMLEKGTIRRITPEHSAALAAELRAHADRLTAALKTWKVAKEARDKQLALRNSFVQVARIQLVNLKRAYKNLGFSEAAIHRVIPNRKRSAAGPDAPEPVEPEVPAAPPRRALISVAPEPADAEADLTG